MVNQAGGVSGEQRILHHVAARWNVADAADIPDDVAEPDRIGVGRAGDAHRGVAALNNVVREGRVGRAKSAGAAVHFILNAVVDQGIVNDGREVSTVVAGQSGARFDVAVAVADVDADIVSFEVIAVNLVVITVDADTAGINHVVSIINVVIAVALADLAATFAILQAVVTISGAARRVRDRLVFATDTDEEIVFHGGERIGQADAAQTEADALLAVPAHRRKIMEVIVMDPDVLGDAAAGALHFDKLAGDALRAELVVIDNRIVGHDVEVRASARAPEDVAR